MPRYRIVHVDDEPVRREQVKDLLDGDEQLEQRHGGVEVSSFSDFDAALDDVAGRGADLIILDVVRGGAGVGPADVDTVGRDAFQRIRSTCFVPVLFYTGYDAQVQDIARELPLIRVVAKGESVDRLVGEVRAVFDHGLPALTHALNDHLREVEREYMWEFVAREWDRYRELDDPAGLAHLLVRRLAMSLSVERVSELAEALGAPAGEVGEGVHPMRFYVMPPLPGARARAGDIRLGVIDGVNSHWIVLTPSCDFARRDPETVLRARCELLSAQKEHIEYMVDQSRDKTDRLRDLIRNRGSGRQADRFHYLPAALDVPDLLTDLCRLKTVPWADFSALQRIASLDTPYAEALLAQFARYVGRLGTPDLDYKFVMRRFNQQLSAGEEGGSNASADPPAGSGGDDARGERSGG